MQDFDLFERMRERSINLNFIMWKMCLNCCCTQKLFEKSIKVFPWLTACTLIAHTHTQPDVIGENFHSQFPCTHDDVGKYYYEWADHHNNEHAFRVTPKKSNQQFCCIRYFILVVDHLLRRCPSRNNYPIIILLAVFFGWKMRAIWKACNNESETETPINVLAMDRLINWTVLIGGADTEPAHWNRKLAGLNIRPFHQKLLGKCKK